MTFITSLFSVASWATWVFLPLNAIFLTFDGIVYSLVAYSYELFTLMSQMNFNVIYAWVSPLIDRIQALIMVLIMFKLGISLLQYMLNPDKFTEKKAGGPALIKNIAISAALLVGYSFVFSVLNELSLLIIGVPDGYEFTVLNDLAEVTNDGNDPGLISRFVFGDTSETDDFGKFLSVSTLQIFLHGKDNTTSDVEKVYANVMKKGDEGSDFNMMEIVTVVSNIDRDVEYKWPLLSTAMGLYLIYSIVKIAIEVGVRMFKLVILQILAPVAIISIIDNGFDSKIWKSFIDTYWKTFIDIFIRVASMFIVTAFISKFWTDKTQLFPEVDSVTQGLVLIIIIVAGYRLAGMLPKFIDSVFGSKLSENNSKGIGNFLGAVGGAALGGVAGLATGLAAGAGAGAAIGNMFSGAYNGSAAGLKGKGVADFFKGQTGNIKNSAASAIAAKDGKYGFGTALGRKIGAATGVNDIHNNRIEGQIKNSNKAFDAETDALNAAFTAETQAREDRIEGYNNSNLEMTEIERTITENMKHEASGYHYADGSDILYGDNGGDITRLAIDNDERIRNLKHAEEAETANLQSDNHEKRATAVSKLKAIRTEREKLEREIAQDVKTNVDDRMNRDVAANGTTVQSRKEQRRTNDEHIRQEQRNGIVSNRTHSQQMSDRQKAHDKEIKDLGDRKY